MPVIKEAGETDTGSPYLLHHGLGRDPETDKGLIAGPAVRQNVPRSRFTSQDLEYKVYGYSHCCALFLKSFLYEGLRDPNLAHSTHHGVRFNQILSFVFLFYVK